MLELRQELDSVVIGEAGAMAHEVEVALIVEQAEQDRADLVAILVDPVSADYAITIAPVFPLDPDPLVLDVGFVVELADDSVTAGAFVLREPPLRFGEVTRHRGEVPREREVAEKALESFPTFGPRRVAQVLSADSEQVEGHELGGNLARQQLNPRGSGMDPALELVELRDVVDNDDDFAVDHRPCRKLLESGEQFREVPQEWLAVAALQLWLGAAPGHGPEAIPLRFIHPAFALRRGRAHPGLHGLDR